VVLGIAARIAHFGDSLLGDELSTLYIVQDHGPHAVYDLVKSNAEISPPLYFGLAWLSTQIGSAAELIRLPALIAGLASIPLAYLLARRLFGSLAGLVAAGVMALNPFMVFYATDGRPYTVAIALLLASTLTMLIAAERNKVTWWAAYAALVALAMYAHYTAAFILGAQLLWLLWARPQARVAALVATAAAALAYLPWVPGAIDDSNSPTVDILSALQGNGIGLKIDAIGTWAFGYPFNATSHLPGTIPLWIGIAAVVLLAVGAGVRLAPRLRDGGRSSLRSPENEAFVLAIAIAVATPVCEATLLLAGGTDLLGARNLNTASGGFAILIGGMAATAAPAIATAGVAALIGVFAIGTVKSLDPTNSTVDFRGAANFIDDEATAGDVVVDMYSTQLSPVPTTSIDAHMSDAHPLINLYQPPGPPPLLSAYPPPGPILKRAATEADGHRIFIVAPEGVVKQTGDGVSVTLAASNIFITSAGHAAGTVAVRLPGRHLEQSRRFDGIFPVVVDVLGPPKASGG
jgi:hypothetical protein